MLRYYGESQLLGYVIIVVMTFNVGGVLSVGVWQNDVKDTFRLTQTQVEVLASVMIFGSYCGLVIGLLLEHCGIRRTGCAALFTALAYFALLASLHHPDNFNKGLFPLLILFFLLAGLGCLCLYLGSLTLFLQKFGTQYGGRAVAASGVGIGSSFTLIASGVFKIEGTMIYLAATQVLGSLLAICLLKKSETNKSAEKTKENEETKESDTKDSNSQNVERTDEKTLLKRQFQDGALSTTNQKAGSEPIFGDVTGWSIIRHLDFWLIVVFFVVGSSMAKTFVSNIATYLRSFRSEDHLHTITSIAPWFFICVKMSIGIMTDFFREQVPRVLYLIVVLSIQTPVLFFFIFYGNHMAVMYTMTFIMYVSLASFFAVGPIILGEYFGLKYFALNFGVIYLIDGCLVIIFQIIIGLIYDAHIDDVTTHTCYGLRCFYASSGLMFTLSLVTLVVCVLLWIRSRRREKAS